MENLATIDRLSLALESEEASDELTALAPDTYVKLANYAQKLLSAAGSGSDDPPTRIAKKQLWLIGVMTRRLLELRLSKASKQVDKGHEDGQPAPWLRNLLPEERYVDDAHNQLSRREERFVKAVVDGQPSFFTITQRTETQRMTTVRVSKRIGEIIGADLKKYGPFEVNDVARLPLGNAQVMVASKQASFVAGDDYE